jgi:hypothetical protein
VRGVKGSPALRAPCRPDLLEPVAIHFHQKR